MSLSDYTKTVSRQGRVDITNLNIQFGTGKQSFTALHNLSMSAKPGEFVCLLGSSGCGKSTLLAALAGHIQANGGSILIDGQQINGPHPERGLVFQQHTLFPWKKIIDNVAFGLKMKGISRATRHEQARELLKLMGLAGFENHYPAQLSGGMLQRVEIARVLINSPKVMLMDEPFGALDAQTRMMMQQLLLEVWERIKTTIVFITHDIDEALFLADRVLVMGARPGRIIEEIDLDFARPRHAELITSSHFMQLKRHCLELLHPQNSHFPLQRVHSLSDAPVSEPDFAHQI